MKKEHAFVVIPAYNEETHIKEVIKKVKKYCDNIVIVDDGSTDKTGEIAQSFNVHVISLPINMGKGYAMRKGIEFAISNKAKKIITMDSDGQHRPEHIPKFIKLLDRFDVVIGIRRGHHPVPFVRKAGNYAAALLIWVIYGIRVRDLLCGFRGIKSKAFPYIIWQSNRYGVETEMIARVGMSQLKYAELEIENIYLDQFKGVTLLDALEVFLSIPTFKIKKQ
jgi:glycosyltransferase involved in cell wall biosynthesis